jgi:hypothetical protein
MKSGKVLKAFGKFAWLSLVLASDFQIVTYLEPYQGCLHIDFRLILVPREEFAKPQRFGALFNPSLHQLQLF